MGKEGFLKRLGNRIGKALITEPINVGTLDDTFKRYTEKDIFEATEEAFRVGYAYNSDSGIEPEKIGNNRILNKHKEWFLSVKNIKNFKK